MRNNEYERRTRTAGPGRRPRRLLGVLVACLLAAVAARAADDPSPPASPVRLIFLHHSTGENWLDDGNGGLGIALRNNRYFVADTNYGWGPDAIGDRTDIGNWWSWFRGPDSSTYLRALYAESGQHSSYSRLATNPGGENEIVLFKSCFPNSALAGRPSDPVPPIGSNPLRGEDSGSSHHTIANAKGIYLDLLQYFRTRPDKLFVVATAPPLSDGTWSANARAFNDWLVRDWLAGYPYPNVFVFDFYNVLTTNGGNAHTNDLGQAGGNHHRFWNGAVQHKTDGDNDNHPNVLEYPSGDDHPSRAGNLKATAELLPLLNIAYRRFKGTPPTGPVLAVSPRTLAASCDRGRNPPAQEIAVANAGIGTLHWQATWDVAWLEGEPATGDSTGEADPITITYSTSGLTPGTYTGHIQVADPAATGSPATVTVTLTVGPGGTFRVSGYVRTAAGKAVRGVKLAFGNGGGAALTNRQGFYSRTLPAGWSGVVTPRLAGYRFDPPNTRLGALTADRSLSFTALPR